MKISIFQDSLDIDILHCLSKLQKYQYNNVNIDYMNGYVIMLSDDVDNIKKYRYNR